MNNPFQMIQAIRNPQEYLQRAMQNPQIMSNPVARNAFELYQKGDINGINEMASNLCKERGIKPEEITNQIRSMFGM